MRVQVNRDEQGATALLLVFMTIMFLGFAAIAVDAGYGFVSKRNLQNAADAGALSAADYLVSESGSCAQVAADTDAVDEAQAIAEQFSEDNRSAKIETGFEVRCSDDNRRIEVWYRNGGTTSTVFAPMIGEGSATAAEREAVASVGVPGSLTGLRPYFVCITDADALRASSGWLRVGFPNASCGNQPGNWYTVDCPEDGQGNGTPVIAVNTREGCASEVSVVDLTSAGGDPVLEKQLLLAACTGSPPLSAENGCLTGNTGNLSSNPLKLAWDTLLGQTITLPVFELDTVVGTGNNARYPIRAIMGAKVCGYKWNSKDNISTDPECAGVSIPGGNQNFLWLKYDSYQTTGTSKPSTCAVGDPNCDYGLRNVSLDE